LSDGEKEGILYLSPWIVPPRLKGKTEEEILRLAGENRERIEPHLETIRKSGASALIINDLSLYFHAGDAPQLWLTVERIPTVVMNGYYGRHFGEGSVSRKERGEMKWLMARCDRVLFLPPTP